MRVSGEGLLLHVVEEDPVRRYVVGRQPEDPSYWLEPHGRGPFVLSGRRRWSHHDLCEEAQWKLSAVAAASSARSLSDVGRGGQGL